MTMPADDTAVEDAFEAFLAGRPVPAEAADLAVFAEAVRATATQPGRPNAALAELLATGLLTDQSSPSVRTARSAGAPPSRGTRTRNRRRFAMIFPALLAKILSAGAVAQAATGAGIVVVVATGAGATGVLGEDVQDTITSVVAPSDEETATTEDTVADDETLPTGPDAVETPAEEIPVPVVPTEGEFDPETWVADGPAGYASFGAWVSDSAHNPHLRAWLQAKGMNFGSMVRDWAHKKGVTEEDLAEEGVDLDALIDGGTGSTPIAEPTDPSDGEATATVERTVAESGKRGNGNGGNGNGGNGGNGNGGNGSGNGGKGNGRN